MLKAQHTSPADVRDVRKLLGLALELVLLLFVIYYFKLESQAFFRLAVLASAGFVVHYFLPFRVRIPFFLLLSLAGIALVLGWQGLWLIGLAFLLIAICHLPASFRVRVGCLLLAGAVMAFLRAGWVAVPWSVAIWPILASMFMFRTILYMYDLSHKATPASIWQRLSYFFLLPNVCFPLFPVVDYRTFLRTYYNEERHRIYQIGVHWIFRGLTQLILYRVVYYYLSMAPAEVDDSGDLVRFVISGFLLYLRISGQFHVIVGILRLFGFNLPESHHLYFLSTSFSDFWRRINIYWKDFMVTMFFYPSYFALRRRGETMALLTSTAVVFVATWVLHAYQWFWIRGSYHFAWNDVLFWTALGVLVMANTLLESRRGRQRPAAAQSGTLRRTLGVVARTAGTFVVIATLWSLWTSASVSEWITVWRAGLSHPVVEDPRLPIAVALGAAGFIAVTIWFALRERSRLRGSEPDFGGSMAMVVASAVAVCVVGTPELYDRLLPAGAAGTYAAVVGSTREVRLSGHDADLLQRGYYEDLLGIQSFNSQLWQVYASWPLNWSRLEDTGALRLTGDFLYQELVPSKEIHFRNATLRTNRWGMRDKEYELHRPPGTYRFELVGSSHVMGYGVDDDQTFDALLERRLNAPRPGQPPQAYEVLNFAVDGYTPLQELYQLESRDLRFEPDAVLYVAHYGAPYRAALHLADMARAGVAIPYPELADIARQAGIHPGISRFDAEHRIWHDQDEILAWAYRRMVSAIRAHGALPVWVYLPQMGDHVTAEQLAQFVKMARDAGFVTVSLADCFDGANPKSVVFGEWDHHPNVLGHQLIAKKLFERLQRDVLPLRGGPGAKSTLLLANPR